jgi:hypothetical protein
MIMWRVRGCSIARKFIKTGRTSSNGMTYRGAGGFEPM